MQVDESENIAELGARLKSAKESFVLLYPLIDEIEIAMFD